MLTINNYSNQNNFIPQRTQKNCSTIYNSPNFKGHIKTEAIYNKGLKFLIHQTMFNREPETKNFVCDYIRNHFSHKPNINIISGGCSTGEEAVTYSMLLYDMKNNVNILGIDIGKKAIKQAKSREYIFSIPDSKINLSEYYNDISQSEFSDNYLINPNIKGLTPTEYRFKSLFNEFFEPAPDTKVERLIKYFKKMIDGENQTYLRTEKKKYKLKDGMADNCRFIQGDISDIDKLMKDEKADVISFSNAMYHLTTKNLCFGEREPIENREEIVKTLLTKFKNCLNDNGIVVFGEREEEQMLDNITIPKVMNELGFQPLNKTDNHSANVWKINKNYN